MGAANRVDRRVVTGPAWLRPWQLCCEADEMGREASEIEVRKLTLGTVEFPPLFDSVTAFRNGTCSHAEDQGKKIKKKDARV